MKKTLREIASLVGGEVEGNGDVTITGIAGIQDAGPGQLSFVVNEKYAALAGKSEAAALMVPRDLDIEGFDLIKVDDPAAAWNRIMDLVKPEPPSIPVGVHDGARVSEEAVLGKDVTVMPFATVESGALIGDRTLLFPGVYVGHQSRIGADCTLYPNVVIRERITLGDRVIVHGGSVIGADGFGYEPEGRRLKKQEQFGTVVVEDDVEIGAGVTIDRARFDVTRIGRGTKIDNLVQIAHNVILGEGCIIVSQVGIAGSTRIGKNVVLAGQVGIAGHLKISDNVKVAAQSGIGKDIPENEVYFGSPAVPFREKTRELAAVKKLPGLLKIVRDLEKRLSRLEAQSEND